MINYIGIKIIIHEERLYMKKALFLALVIIIFHLPARATDIWSVEDNLIIDKLLTQSTREIYESFTKISESKLMSEDGSRIEGFAIKFEKDSIYTIPQELIQKTSSQFEKRFSKSEFSIYESDKLEDLLKEQSIQMEDFYAKAGRLKIGSLTQWKGLLLGSVHLREEYKFCKKNYYLDISAKFLNLETGEMLWSDTITKSQKSNLPLYLYLVGSLALFILILLINSLTQGKYTRTMISLTLILLLLYTLWFFII